MESATEEITLAELLEMAMDARQVDMHTAFPAKVDSYNNSKQTINCTPQIKRHVPDGQGNWIDEALPALADVPVCFPRVGGFFMSFPIQAGDFVLVVVCQKNLAAWRASGSANDPGDLGMHTLDGAVAIPGIFPDSKALSNAGSSNMILGSDTDGNGRIELKSGGVNLGAGASKGVAREDDTTDDGTLVFNPGTSGATLIYFGPGIPVPGPTPGTQIPLSGKINSSSAHIKAVD